MSWDELEKRRTADIVSRRFGVSAKETVFVRDGYELVRYIMRCAEPVSYTHLTLPTKLCV